MDLTSFIARYLRGSLGKRAPTTITPDQKTQACVALLQRRPDLARQVGLDPQAMQGLINKTEIIDLLGDALYSNRR